MTAIASHLTCDILVAGGSFSAVAAALAAARTNFKARVTGNFMLPFKKYMRNMNFISRHILKAMASWKKPL